MDNDGEDMADMEEFDTSEFDVDDSKCLIITQ